MQAIRRLAIVNRGEAALRCIRTVKSLRAVEGSDMEVVALYTDVDRNAPFVRHADRAKRLPITTTAVASYLDHALLLDTLERVGADAVWPGWGFVAESAAFVDALDAAGIRFLGPSGDAMRQLGDKIQSKRVAESIDVPVSAWSGGVVADLAEARQVGERIGYPLVVKASAGGGGRGIRTVRTPDALEAAFTSASSEAVTAFGDGRLFMEAMVENGRHIEVQIVADEHGNVHALGVRDCSVQRRHQKVIEEAPPPGLAPELLDAMERAAERLAAKVGYRGVGTVEFLVKAPTFVFLEMNPRLQVEHGITEETTGTDLVELQIRIARGESLADLQINRSGHCIEARVCAEDPSAGFLPAPGKIVLFEPALGPSLRVDTGVATGTTVPPDFDSLVAKVLASGATREQARSRLVSALRDFDLVVKGGATNKGYLLDVLDTPDFRAGAVDVLWLDRWNAAEKKPPAFAPEALVLAAVLAHRSARDDEREGLYADPMSITPDKVPAAEGRELDLEYRGEQYRVTVFGLGLWHYWVRLGDHVARMRLDQSGPYSATVEMADNNGGRKLGAVFDVTPSHIRVEIAGSPHQFGRFTAGQVRAGTPSTLVSIAVEEGQHVEAGQSLGLLEAMKMEISFNAPITGTVTEVRVRKGQQLEAGDVLLNIDADSESDDDSKEGQRLVLPSEKDPLAVLFAPDETGPLGTPDLTGADLRDPIQRQRAVEALRFEVSSALLGFDVSPPRLEKVIEFLDAPLPSGLSQPFRDELATIRQILVTVADIENLFSREQRTSASGAQAPSNYAWLRMFVRRARSEGSGVPEAFLDLVRQALLHYDVRALSDVRRVERALLRIFATQKALGRRQQLIMAVLRRFVALVDTGVTLSGDDRVEEALSRIEELRGRVSNAIADAAIEARYVGYEMPDLARQIGTMSERLEAWLDEVETMDALPIVPMKILNDLAIARPELLNRVRGWLSGSDKRRQSVGLAATIRRFYTPQTPDLHHSRTDDWIPIEYFKFGETRVLGAVCHCGEVVEALKTLAAEIRPDHPIHVELVVVDARTAEIENARDAVASAMNDGLTAQRVTLSLPNQYANSFFHETFERATNGDVEMLPLQGLHPEAAERVQLSRFSKFELERLRASEDVYCFHAQNRDDKSDERIFVLADVLERPADGSADSEVFLPILARWFQQATHALRLNLVARDPERRLQWNRVVMAVAHPIAVQEMKLQSTGRRLLPMVRHLGVEKTIVRLHILRADGGREGGHSRETEIVFQLVAGSRFGMLVRDPHREPLVPASPYERRAASARRRGLVHPYEVIRMLSRGDVGREREIEGAAESARPVLPVGAFEEYDLDPDAAKPTAMSVAGRASGENVAAVVFGILSTPTSKVPEGMKRVFIASDPTLNMGALAAPECDRVEAAIDLAESLSLPIEWIPVSSGARIAMNSGTENLDATARVVRRIITYTQAGGVIHLLVTGINVGAQSYWDALAAMLLHTRGVLIMTPEASMVLTGRAALAASGAVSAEDEVSIGGYERVMGPNGEAHYLAADLLEGYRILYDYYNYSYVVPGEAGPRTQPSSDPASRDIAIFAYDAADTGAAGFGTVGEIFDNVHNPGRKRPFAIRAVMKATIDGDGGHLERWPSQVGGETAVVWDAHIGGQPVSVIGIESYNVPRLGYRPPDGPTDWNGGTLFPQASKKVARALTAASGNRPAVILANLSGFDGSPESMRKLQLEYGAEIARAVVNFEGPIIFLIIARYHGGAYVVFSRELNPNVRALAVEGSYASVIGGGPAASVVFTREVRARVAADPRLKRAREVLAGKPTDEERSAFDRVWQEVTLEKRSELAAEFDGIHTVERAREVGSIEAIISPHEIRSRIIELLREG